MEPSLLKVEVSMLNGALRCPRFVLRQSHLVTGLPLRVQLAGAAAVDPLDILVLQLCRVALRFAAHCLLSHLLRDAGFRRRCGGSVTDGSCSKLLYIWGGVLL